jgi:predicted dehydrogenase
MGFPLVVPARVLGRGGVAAPSERIRAGLIGCGNHGVYWNLAQAFRYPDVEVVALCDVDKEHLADAARYVEEHQTRPRGAHAPSVALETDFRKLILRPDVDVIFNCTPDHWHIIPAIMAAKCGKDVLCEKPLTLFVAEGQALCRAVKEHGRVFQTASENRSIDVFRRLVALVRGGAIGSIRHIEVGLPTGNTEMRLGPQAQDDFQRQQVSAVPATLDYDMWLGQAPKLPYIPARVHGSFRWNLAFSGGVLTDWGAHMIDLAQWGHRSEDSGPVEVEGKGDFPPHDAVFNTAATCEVHYRYGDGVTMTVSTRGAMIRFEGEKGWVECPGWRAGVTASDPEILKQEVDESAVGMPPISEVVKSTDGNHGGEYRNFLDCVKTRGRTYAPAEVGHRTITIAHIGNIAMLLGRKLRWDPVKEEFEGDAEANARLTREQRSPWTMAAIDTWI